MIQTIVYQVSTFFNNSLEEIPDLFRSFNSALHCANITIDQWYEFKADHDGELAEFNNNHSHGRLVFKSGPIEIQILRTCINP